MTENSLPKSARRIVIVTMGFCLERLEPVSEFFCLRPETLDPVGIIVT